MARPIDANALVAELQKKPIHDGHFIHTRDVSDAIFNAPTLSPDEVRGVGKWIWHDNYGWDDSLECSCCAEEFVVYDGEFPGIDSFKYCPSCGARMKGAEDGTTDNT